MILLRENALLSCRRTHLVRLLTSSTQEKSSCTFAYRKHFQHENHASLQSTSAQSIGSRSTRTVIQLGPCRQSTRLTHLFTRRVGTAAKKFHFTQPLDKDVRFTLHLEANHGADCSLRLQMGEVDVRTGQRKFYTVRPFRLPLYCEWPCSVTLLRLSCRCLL